MPSHDAVSNAAGSDRACPYCGLADHTGREHFQFVMALGEDCPGCGDLLDLVLPCTVCGRPS